MYLKISLFKSLNFTIRSVSLLDHGKNLSLLITKTWSLFLQDKYGCPIHNGTHEPYLMENVIEIIVFLGFCV